MVVVSLHSHEPLRHGGSQQLSDCTSDPRHRRKCKPDPVNLAKNPWLGSSQAPKVNLTTVILSSHSIKLTSKFSFLFPEIGAAVRVHQTRFFVQWRLMQKLTAGPSTDKCQ